MEVSFKAEKLSLSLRDLSLFLLWKKDFLLMMNDMLNLIPLVID